MTGADSVGLFHLFCTNKQPDIFAAQFKNILIMEIEVKSLGGDAGSIVLPYQIS